MKYYPSFPRLFTINIALKKEFRTKGSHWHCGEIQTSANFSPNRCTYWKSCQDPHWVRGPCCWHNGLCKSDRCICSDATRELVSFVIWSVSGKCLRVIWPHFCLCRLQTTRCLIPLTPSYHGNGVTSALTIAGCMEGQVALSSLRTEFRKWLRLGSSTVLRPRQGTLFSST